MKKIKNLTLGILGATVLSLSLISCNNDDTMIEDATTEQTMASKSFGNIKIIPGFPGLGMVSSYAGSCVPGGGFCFENNIPDTKPIFGIGRLDNSTIRLTMNMETYQSNEEFLSEGIFEVEADFSLNEEISKEMGFETETVVTKQTAKVIQANAETFYMDLNVKKIN